MSTVNNRPLTSVGTVGDLVAKLLTMPQHLQVYYDEETYLVMPNEVLELPHPDYPNTHIGVVIRQSSKPESAQG